MEDKTIQILLRELETCVRATALFWDGTPAQEFRAFMEEMILEMNTLTEERNESRD